MVSPGPKIETSQLPAHQMALVEQKPVFRRHLIDAQHQSVFESANGTHRLLNLGQNPQTLPIASPARKRIALEISGKPDSRRDHDVGI